MPPLTLLAVSMPPHVQHGGHCNLIGMPIASWLGLLMVQQLLWPSAACEAGKHGGLYWPSLLEAQ